MHFSTRAAVKNNDTAQTISHFSKGVRLIGALAMASAVLAQAIAPQAVYAEGDAPPLPSGVVAVVATPGRGFYAADTPVTLTGGTGIKYTLDGSNPCTSPTAVTGAAVTITRTTVLRASNSGICSAAAGPQVGTEIKPIASFTYLFTAKVVTQNNTEFISDRGFPKFWARGSTSQTLRTMCNFPDEGMPADAETVPNTPAGTEELLCGFPADYAMEDDPDFLLKYPTTTIEAALKSIPSVSISTDPANLWYTGPYSNSYNPTLDYGLLYNSNEKSSDIPDSGFRIDPLDKRWERPISIEWISPTVSGSTSWYENAGVRIHGQASRKAENTPKKTFRIYFSGGRYGTPKLDFQLFDSFDAVGKFDRIILRNGGNRSWPYHDRDQRREADYVNDEMARKTWLQMGYLGPNGGTFVHLYLNGMYYGLYNVTERIDEKMVQSYLGGDETTYDMITADEDQDDLPAADNGDLAAFNELFTFDIGTATPTSYTDAPISEANYQALKSRINLTEFADYILHNHYVGKTDWPNHNWNMYRPRTGTDTRFRFMQWDNDSGFNKYGENTTLRNETVFDAPYDSPMQIFFRLSTHPDFKQLLTDRMYKHVVSPDGVLAVNNCRAMYTSLTNKIQSAIIAESARWGDYSRDFYHRLDVSPDKSWPAYLYSKDFNYTSVPSNSTVWAFGATNPHPAGAALLKETDLRSWVQVTSTKTNNRFAPNNDLSDSRAGYCLNRPLFFSAMYRQNGWYLDSILPPVYRTPLGVEKRGGSVALNEVIVLANPNAAGVGDIYYTLDGSDPRAEGGAVAPAAILGGDAVNVTINKVLRIRARVRTGADWSALMDYYFYPPQPFSNLVINEIHYSPSKHNPAGTSTWPADEDHWEYVELFNRGTVPLVLDNAYFTRGISHRFGPGTVIFPGQYMVLASEPLRFAQRYPSVTIGGDYRGNLSNSGEPIELRDALGNLIDSVSFQNGLTGWPALPVPPALVTGRSLEAKNPATDNAVPTNWAVAASDPGGITDQAGTPGRQNRSFSGNFGPAVTVTAPSNGGVINLGSGATLSADATDSDGVKYVEFWLNNTLVASDTTAPYAIPLPASVTVGPYSFFAIAIDNASPSAGSTSTPVNFTVVSAAPVVTITAPGPAQVLPQGLPFTITALATDSESTIGSVVFNVNGSPVCTVTSAPYQCVWTPALGTYSITVSATDATGQTGVSQPREVTVQNAAPTAFVAAPLDGSPVPHNLPVKITAKVADVDGSITGVSIRVDNAELCALTAPPYECSFTPTVLDANYTIVIVATDNNGGQGISPPVVVTAKTGVPPTVSVTAPANGATLQAGTAVMLTANAAATQPATVQTVRFLVNGEQVCSLAIGPYTCSWTPPAAGTYDIVAVATDSSLFTTTSTSVRVTASGVVQPPTGFRVLLPVVRRSP
jgi:hypothetical protein